MTTTLTVSSEQEQLARRLVEQVQRPAFAAVQEELRVEVPPALGELIQAMLRTVAEGGNVTIQTLPEELSTTVAADQIGVSRPTLMRMIRDGEIAAHKVGSHHRLKLEDVTAARHTRLRRQREAFEELRRLEDGLD